MVSKKLVHSSKNLANGDYTLYSATYIGSASYGMIENGAAAGEKLTVNGADSFTASGTVSSFRGRGK